MLSLLDSFDMNIDLTGRVSDDEPGDAQNRPLRGFRKRWRPSSSVAADSQLILGLGKTHVGSMTGFILQMVLQLVQLNHVSRLHPCDPQRIWNHLQAQ